MSDESDTPDALSRNHFVTPQRQLGRPPKAAHAASAAERQQSHRAKDKALSQLAAEVLHPYFGAKAAIAEVVWERLGAVRHYTEPFAGSAGVYLQCPYRLRHATLNDTDGHLVNVYRSLAGAAKLVAAVAHWPASQVDLDARSRHLYASQPALVERLQADWRYYDADLAGLWLYCMSARMPTRLGKGLGHGKEYLQMTTAHALFAAGKRDRVSDICAVIQAKLRDARLPCGDWRTVLREKYLQAHGHPVGVFLDPPYDQNRRDKGLYAQDSDDVAHAVREWAAAHGGDVRLRIALCGLEGEHAMPAGWTAHPWTARGGMANTKTHGRGSGETRKEVVMFSPHCVRPAQLNLLQETS